jgi:hypothetical protein
LQLRPGAIAWFLLFPADHGTVLYPTLSIEHIFLPISVVDLDVV